MNTRCYRCGWSLSLSRETIAAALANASATGTKHHIERCPKCRQTIKIPIDQLKRFAPHDETASDLEPQPPPVAASSVPTPTPAAEVKAAEAGQSSIPSPQMEAAASSSEKNPGAEKTSAPKKKATTKSSTKTKSSKPAASKPAAKRKTSSK